MILTKIIIILFKRKRYLLTAGSLAIGMVALSYYLMVFNITGKSIVAYSIMNGAAYTIGSLLLTMIIAIFFGIHGAVWLFWRDIRRKREKSKGSLVGIGGALGGIVASGCPTCGAPLLALMGAPLALLSLPFRGIEIKVVSIALLISSTYWLLENVYRQISGSCQVESS
ncbi:hypothetical protein HZA86_02900 [Candidatus Uhrbacteria bacterium]|nr:hypothetical protein [Candidatus Uhrbacteria bacterium]